MLRIDIVNQPETISLDGEVASVKRVVVNGIRDDQSVFRENNGGTAYLYNPDAIGII